MRKITQKIAEAFREHRKLKIDNTETDGSNVWLFGKKIISYGGIEHNLVFTLAGWNTLTTRERLNGILPISLTMKKGVAYFNGNPIEDDEWYEVGV